MTTNRILTTLAALTLSLCPTAAADHEADHEEPHLITVHGPGGKEYHPIEMVEDLVEAAGDSPEAVLDFLETLIVLPPHDTTEELVEWLVRMLTPMHCSVTPITEGGHGVTLDTSEPHVIVYVALPITLDWGPLEPFVPVELKQSPGYGADAGACTPDDGVACGGPGPCMRVGL